jgi:REP element-mobilizing transposase RayT
MARKLRVEYPGAIYHLMNRGNRKEIIYRDEADRQVFLDTLAEACGKTAWEIHAYCLMPNHFHLVAETPRANLVAGMKWLLGTYTLRFNRRHRLTGHLFSGRYKALILDGSGNGYLRTVCDYVHLNPARARLVKAEEPLKNYRWSSWPEYLKSPKSRSAWLRVDRLLGEYGLQRESAAGRKQLEVALEFRRQAESDEDFKGVCRGWCLGDEEFRRGLLERMEEEFGKHHSGAERGESAEEHAERLVREELRQEGWGDGELKRRRKADPAKARIARRLREETTMTLAWIASRLEMGSPSTVSLCLQSRKR